MRWTYSNRRNLPYSCTWGRTARINEMEVLMKGVIEERILELNSYTHLGMNLPKLLVVCLPVARLIITCQQPVKN